LYIEIYESPEKLRIEIESKAVPDDRIAVFWQERAY
jgi:hypothetical protein